MFEIYKLCIFLGLYFFIFAFAGIEVVSKLKTENVELKKYNLKRISFIFSLISVLLLGSGCILHNFIY